MAVTTDPSDRTAASPHSGGWSESFYTQSGGFQDLDFFQAWANQRAQLLAGECSVVGFRQQNYTISGNKLLPGGAASGHLNYPGTWPKDLDVPQAALMVNFTVGGQPQTIRHRLAGVPDSQVTFGEWQPDPQYRGAVTKYISAVMVGFGVGAPLAAVTHDLAQQEVRVNSITPLQDGNTATLVTSGATGTVPGGYIRLHRVRDDDGLPVSGAFLVNATQAVGQGQQSYTIAGYLTAQKVTQPNGLARNDLLVVNGITAGVPNRIVVRKIGRPFEQYRGRRSRRPKV